jgi:hypothetical protein
MVRRVLVALVALAFVVLLCVAHGVAQGGLLSTGAAMWSTTTPPHLWMWVVADPGTSDQGIWDLPPAEVEFLDAPDRLRICVVTVGCTTLGDFRAWLARSR